MAWQLMGCHRYFFLLDQADMEDLEDALDLLRISDRDRQIARLSRVRPPWLGRAWAYKVWQAGFFLIALTDIGIGLSAWWPAHRDLSAGVTRRSEVKPWSGQKARPAARAEPIRLRGLPQSS
jgi:hypothetical protein